jgi:hypothetical protein
MVISEGERKRMSVPQLLHFHSSHEQIGPVEQLHISRAFFANGLIRANISWPRVADRRVRQYDLSWIETQCHSDVFSCCYRRDAVTTQNFFQLYDLRFDCQYLVNVRPTGLDSAMNKSFQWHFNVSSCESTDVDGQIRPPCLSERRTSKACAMTMFRRGRCSSPSVDIFSSIPPLHLLVTRNRTGLIFHWQTIHSSSKSLYAYLRSPSLSRSLSCCQ